MARPRAHLPILAAACAAGYAASLALVAGLQSQHDLALAAARAPMQDAARRAASERARALALVTAATEALADASAGYQAAADASARLDAALASLAEQVAAATGAAAQLPARLALPAAPSSVRQVVVPATQATTGASGG